MPTRIPADYDARVYAGVLGKVIGVYLGRPFEQWPYEEIARKLGEIRYYVHEKVGAHLIVSDDDLSGTFGFLRAREDYGPAVTAEQIGRHWLNQIIERQTILWWGGIGMSTEHTAFLRLKSGVPAPRSGSIELNGATVAEQIGSQIFIDGWGLVNPGNPERAAEEARRAASVSHDGVAIDGAAAVAAMVARAFETDRIDDLLDTAQRFIPADGLLRRVYDDLRSWHAGNPGDWRATRVKLVERYGYERYGGGCHMVPNHAVILLGLLYGQGDFAESMMVTNTAAYDTDCNAGNVGCILGVAGGLAGLETGPDWRGPVADRMILPTAEGGRCVTDCLREATWVANLGRIGVGLAPVEPKGGARFHFSQPGSVQGFRADDSAAGRDVMTLGNPGDALCLTVRALAPGRLARASAPTWLEEEQRGGGGYASPTSPTFYPGQSLRATFRAVPDATGPMPVALTVGFALDSDELQWLTGPTVEVTVGQSVLAEWTPPLDPRAVVLRVGVTVPTPTQGRSDGSVAMEALSFAGSPTITFDRQVAGRIWQDQWVDATDTRNWNYPNCITQGEGSGLISTGGRDWTDYVVEVDASVALAQAVTVLVRVQGLRRWMGLRLTADGQLQLVRCLHDETVLTTTEGRFQLNQPITLRVEVDGEVIRGGIVGGPTVTANQTDFTGGGIGLGVTEGRLDFSAVRVRPLGVG